MRNRLLFFAKVFGFFFVALLVPNFIPLPVLHPRLALMLLVCFGMFGSGFWAFYVLFPGSRDERLKELSLVGKHGLRKTDANSYTYFVDHPPLADGSPDPKRLRFFWECNGDEMETILPVDRVSLKVETCGSACVEFCFSDAQKGKCSMLAGLAKHPNWWLDESHVKETGFNFALITMSPEELKGEVFLNSEVKYF
ncbi:MAG TPA: hypothetical protein VJ579_01700 [Candidatus Paceibacterota bacterium]|nr:hypothetical protein [Candidatus Paceibacterota bacterium]